MNHIASPPSGNRIAPFVPASVDLGAYIERARDGGNIHPVPEAIQQAAYRHIRDAQRHLAPATPEVMLVWLRALAGAVANPPTDDRDIRVRAEAIWEVCEDLPIGVWVRETRVSWSRRGEAGKFWPAAGELYAHLAAYAATIRNEARGCEKILSACVAATAREADPPEDPAQRQAIGEQWAALHGEMESHLAESTATERTGRLATATPTVSDHTLLAIHERIVAGNPENRASQARVEHLRRKPGATMPEQAPRHAASG